MKKTGAWLVVHALEQIGVRFTFGIPGVHVTELYDELNNSSRITPILVTHEGGGAFMADAISRVSDTIGTLAIVPAAGIAYAFSGIGEAYLDGIPMLIISGGVRTDSGKAYQIHQIDQIQIMQHLSKKAIRVTRHEEIVPTIYEAYNLAYSDEPGPVFIEIPVNILLFPGDVSHLPAFEARITRPAVEDSAIDAAVQLIRSSKKVGLFVGWGAREATDLLIQLAELLGAPVATTLQGLSVFPANHPLHTGMSFGRHAVPAAERAFKDCDCVLAIGNRLGEIATGSYGTPIPENLIHIDINPAVFNQNYPAKVPIVGDAREVLEKLLRKLREQPYQPSHDVEALKAQIQADKQAYLNEWLQHDSGDRVNPAVFFTELRRQLPPDAYVVVDDGNHTFLTAELFPVYQSRHFLSPTDFNCMGYCVPATIGIKLIHRNHQVVGIVGDGAFLMNGMELLTAATHQLGVVVFVFHDGELSQIAQAQEIPYNRKTATVLGNVQIEGMAMATGAAYLPMKDNRDVPRVIQQALELAEQGKPVVVDVNIDYSRRTRFTKGVVKTNLNRFSPSVKLRFIGRALVRRLFG
ncbi:MAG: thiamine pyrophosphate-binding protein [Calditrichaeota bacterium]|nr:thiamine pyrophosphate-binding protein [Calditrichota bacterium]